MGMNLFSLNKAIDSGGKLTSEGKTMVISKGNREVFFGTQVKMGASQLLGAKCSFSNDFACAVSERKEMSLERIYRMLGHPSIESTKETAQRIGLKLTGKLEE